LLQEDKAKLKFKDYPTERLVINSISSRLDSAERQVREAILADIIRYGKPCDAQQLEINDIDNLDQIVNKLIADRIIVADEATNNISFAYPVSALPTAHKVEMVDGRSFHAMCALDAMGSAFTFKQDVRITSHCVECGDAVLIEIIDKKITDLQPHSLQLLHADLSVSDNWAGSC